MKEWNKNITIPNLLSVLRILLILPFVYFFMTGNVLLAGLMLALSGLSDVFDGMIARKFNQVTDLGKMLDPVADKLTQGTVAICLAIWEPVLLPILAIFIVKELAMLAGGIYLVLKRKKRPTAAKWYGKVGTALFYLSFTAIVAMRFFNIDNLAVTIILLAVTAAFMVYAFYEYFKIFRRLLSSTDPADRIDLRGGSETNSDN